MKVSNETKSVLLDELRPEKQQPGDVTVKMAMDDWEVTDKQAWDILEQAVNDDKVIKVKSILLDTGKVGTVYRPVV